MQKTQNLSLFNFNGHQVRVVDIGGDPWFLGRDIRGVLDIAQGGSNYASLSTDEFQRLPRGLASGKGMGRAVIVSESGLYKLAMRSDKPEAKAFQDWVAREVLPSIRKNGAYVKDQEKVATGEMSPMELALRGYEALQQIVADMKARAEKAEAVVTEHLLYVTVDAWRALSGLYLSHAERVRLGTEAGKLMDARGIERKRQKRTLRRAGKEFEVYVNIYPKSVLDEVAGGVGYMAEVAA